LSSPRITEFGQHAMSLDFAQTNHKTVSRYNFVAKLDIVGRVCL
jgi:hypothetical protein